VLLKVVFALDTCKGRCQPPRCVTDHHRSLATPRCPATFPGNRAFAEDPASCSRHSRGQGPGTSTRQLHRIDRCATEEFWESTREAGGLVFWILNFQRRWLLCCCGGSHRSPGSCSVLNWTQSRSVDHWRALCIVARTSVCYRVERRDVDIHASNTNANYLGPLAHPGSTPAS
jgi:hypothetical protein